MDLMALVRGQRNKTNSQNPQSFKRRTHCKATWKKRERNKKGKDGARRKGGQGNQKLTSKEQRQKKRKETSLRAVQKRTGERRHSRWC